MKTLVASAVASLALAACAPIQQARLQERQEAMRQEAQQWMGRVRVFTAKEQSHCDEATRAPDFDAIRDKVELCKIGERANTTPFRFLANDQHPTAAEKQAIARWGALRDEMNAEVNAFFDSIGTPPGLAADAWIKDRSFTYKAVELINELAAGLYQGKMTYGEFAKRRQDVTSDMLAAIQANNEAFAQADYQRRVEAAAIAEQHYANQVKATQAYLNMIGVGEQMMRGTSGGAFGSTGRVICNNNPMASGTMPNSTTCQNY